MDLPMTKARPPAELWGLWTVTHETPSGFWWNHTHGVNTGEGTPMTFVSRKDAEESAAIEREILDEGESMVVARIGVAPAEVPA
jgi:hypothetical protein